MRFGILLALLSLLLSGCSGNSKIKLTGLSHPSRWSDQIRDTANRSFEYAQLSYRAYAGTESFQLDPSFKEIECEPDPAIDFACAIFERQHGTKEVVIAYRGTDSTRDVWTGTITNRQGATALQTFDAVRSSYPKGTPIVVTGHSQGGGLATHVTLNRENVTGYFFNTSPRFRRLGGNIKNDRYSVVEYGEPLKLLRIFGSEPTQLYTSIGCTGGGPLRQHSARGIALCLTKIASWERTSARASLRRNGVELPRGVSD